MKNKKKKRKNEYNGMIFRTKRDLDYYIKLEKLKEEGSIHHFLFYKYIDKKHNETRYKSNPISIDDYYFTSKEDANYYLHLNDLKQKGDIEQFSLTWIESNQGVKTKYSSKKVEIDYHLFDSKTEANYYVHLLEKKRNKKIIDFTLQPEFELQPTFKKYGKTIQKIGYIADFEVEHLDGTIEIVDVKGMITADFRLKQKMFDYQFPEKKLTLMKYVEKFGGWITHDDWMKKRREEKREKRNKK